MNPYIIKTPVITERTLLLANQKNVYTFEVQPAATKHQIAQAVSEIFSVKVEAVNTVSRVASHRRTGSKRQVTSVPRTKKALVLLQKGQTISLFDIQADGASATADQTTAKKLVAPAKKQSKTKEVTKK